ncbi:hypothetical protein GQ44DRAFT_733326 [Phaeosphaeriaceae sp. PMI808]|nr:hypothetical protein GQ44DRAFT_733326 [Phaeosphaeriaceae sp. PMI808]
MHPKVSDSEFETCAQHLIAYGANVNHIAPGREHFIIGVCFNHKHRLVDILLSSGVDPGERRMYSDLLYPTGTSIRALLANAEDFDYDVEYDHIVACLLQKHVLDLKDPRQCELIRVYYATCILQT